MPRRQPRPRPGSPPPAAEVGAESASGSRRAAAPLDPVLASEKRQKKSRIITGSILAAIGLVCLIALWDFSLALFETSGPVPLNLNDFEGNRTPLKSYLNAAGGYSRWVRADNVLVYPFQFFQLDDGSVLYAMVGNTNTFTEKIAEVDTKIQAGSFDPKQFDAQPERPVNARLILRLMPENPQKMRARNSRMGFEKNVNYFVRDPKDVGAIEGGFVGVIRPYTSLSPEYRRQLGTAGVFTNYEYDKDDHVYVLTLNELPPPVALSAVTLAVPLLMIALGIVLLALGFLGESQGKRPRAGKKSSRGKAKGKGSRRLPTNADDDADEGDDAADDEDADEGEGDDEPVEAAPPPAKKPTRMAPPPPAVSAGSRARGKTGRLQPPPARAKPAPAEDEGDPDATMVAP